MHAPQGAYTQRYCSHRQQHYLQKIDNKDYGMPRGPHPCIESLHH